MRHFHSWIAGIVIALLPAGGFAVAAERTASRRPNILFFIADDLGARYTGAYGDPVVQTPAINRLAREGVRFEWAFCASPSYTPSRSAILTGQAIWRLEEGALLFGALDVKFPVFPLMLQDSGYFIGQTGKMWAPGNLRAGGWGDRNPAGPVFARRSNDRNRLYDPPLPDYWANDYAANFKDFLDARPKDRPFFFWCGTIQPHLPWVKTSGPTSSQGMPSWLPDAPIVREDMRDQRADIEFADSHLGRILKTLEEAGELDNTVIIFTGDHGTPLPRAKCNLYDPGTHVPLIVRYPPMIHRGRTVADLVSLTDVTATILELAGLAPTESMTGRSLVPLLASRESGRIDPSRDAAYIAFERHTWCRPEGVGYPMRAIRTADYLYIRNYEPDRWPNGDPDFESPHQGTIGDSDACPTKTYMIEHASDPQVARYFQLAWAKRPAEELYDVRNDPDQLHNLAGDPAHARTRQSLRQRLESYLKETGDPRSRGEAPWDGYPYYFQDYWKRARKFTAPSAPR
jgi:N-sulfoglucosamine sulfohydrolase